MNRGVLRRGTVVQQLDLALRGRLELLRARRFRP